MWDGCKGGRPSGARTMCAGEPLGVLVIRRGWRGFVGLVRLIAPPSRPVPIQPCRYVRLFPHTYPYVTDFRIGEARSPRELIGSCPRHPDHLRDLVDPHQGHVCKARAVSRETFSRHTVFRDDPRGSGPALGGRVDGTDRSVAPEAVQEAPNRHPCARGLPSGVSARLGASDHGPVCGDRRTTGPGPPRKCRQQPSPVARRLMTSWRAVPAGGALIEPQLLA